MTNIRACGDGLAWERQNGNKINTRILADEGKKLNRKTCFMLTELAE
jgi:hypothetical protein